MSTHREAASAAIRDFGDEDWRVTLIHALLAIEDRLDAVAEASVDGGTYQPREAI